MFSDAYLSLTRYRKVCLAIKLQNYQFSVSVSSKDWCPVSMVLESGVKTILRFEVEGPKCIYSAG
jgi:hypothetical protein